MILFRADRLIDGTGATALKGAAVLVEGDRILDAGRAADIGIPLGALIIDAPAGGTLMPGLVDVHVHLAYCGSKDSQAFRAESATMEYPAIALRAVRFARDTLRYGYTSVRDMHAPGGTIIDLRDAVNAGLVEGPRILAPGLGLTVTGGHMDQPGFADHVTFREMNGACDGPVEFRTGVRKQLMRGADFIKLNPCVSNRRDKRLYRFEMTVDEIQAACDEAHEQGVMVAAHTSGGPPLQESIKAGCDTVEHAHWADDATLELMIKQNTWLVPTLAVNSATSSHVRSQQDASQLSRRWAEESERAKWERLTRARAAGVRVAAGSDAGFFLTHGADNGLEIEAFVQGGYSTLEALTIATANGADLMGIDAGRLIKGNLADILIVDGNPLTDVTILRNPAHLRVFKGGREVVTPHCGYD